MTKRFDATPPSHKKCKKCKVTKTIDSFSRDAGMKDNYKNTCKQCVQVYNKEYLRDNAKSVNAKRRRKYGNK